MTKFLLPEFLSLYKSGEVRKPRVRFYEGKQGHLTVYEAILNDKPKELLALIDGTGVQIERRQTAAN